MNEEVLLPDLDAKSNSIFPHFYLCLLLTVACTWFLLDFEIFYWGYFQVGVDELGDGMKLMALAGKGIEFFYIHSPVIFVVCLGFAYFSCEHSSQNEDPKWVMLAKGICGLGFGVFVVLILEWVLASQYKKGTSHSWQEFIVAYFQHLLTA